MSRHDHRSLKRAVHIASVADQAGLRGRQLRPAVEHVRALASFDLDEFSHDFEPPA